MAHSLFALMLFQSLVFASAMMLMVWVLSLKLKNSGVVDVAWPVLFSLVVILYAVCGEGYLPRKLLIASMVCIWSLKQTTELYHRLIAARRAEDAGELPSDLHLLTLFELQGIFCVLLSIPFALICTNAISEINSVEFAASVLWFIALVGALRLPRLAYVFDWMFWGSFFLFALASPWGWTSIYCPIVIFLLQKKTGDFFLWLPKKDSA